MTDDMIRPGHPPSSKWGTREIVVLHHTDCALRPLRTEGFRQHLKERTGVDVRL